ncbi:MAG: hypothetical protein LBG10_03825, partial [Treponema sp.]|nr:hypothetical protein [Treponema sp.]
MENSSSIQYYKAPPFYARSAVPNAAIQSINIPKTKRRLKNVSGVLSAGKTWGPFPIFFPPTPRAAFWERLLP